MIIKPDLPIVNTYNRSTNNQPVKVTTDPELVVKEKKDGEIAGTTLSISAQNRTAAENLKASVSSIQDRDKAKEVMAYARENILSQASNALEAQANQLPQSVLTLLK